MHQMAHKDALWPGAMIRLGPQLLVVAIVLLKTGGYKAY